MEGDPVLIVLFVYLAIGFIVFSATALFGKTAAKLNFSTLLMCMVLFTLFWPGIFLVRRPR